MDDLSEMLEREDGLPRWRRIPEMPDLVLRLKEADFLPAIWFIFSRASCDSAATNLLQTGIRLVTDRDRAIIDKELQVLRYCFARMSHVLRRQHTHVHPVRISVPFPWLLHGTLKSGPQHA